MLKKLRSFLFKLLGKGKGAQLAQGSALLLVAKVFGALSGYAIAFVLTKRGGAEAVGVYELGFTCIMLLSVVSRLGLDGAIVRYIGVYSAQNQSGAIKWLYKNAMGFSVVFASLLGVAVFLLSGWLSSVFGDFSGDKSLIEPFKWAAVTIPFFALLSMNSETLRGFKRMVSYGMLQQGSVIFLAVILLYFFWDPADVGLSGIQAFLFASIGLFLSSQINVIKRLKTLPKYVVPKTGFKEILGVAWPIFLSGSIFLVISWTDTLMVGYFMNKADLGIYRIAFKISTLITFTQFAINGVAAPMIAESYHNNDMAGLRNLIHRIGLLNFVLSIPIFLIILFAPSFLLSLFGEEYLVGKNLLLTLSFGQVVFALSGPVMYMLIMTKHEKTSLYIMYITAALNLVGNVVLIPIYGLQGAAIATAFTTILWNILAVGAVFRFMGIVSVPFIHRFIEKPAGK